MDPLIFLAHRLPYPPNKGDKVRSFHWLKHLAERYRIHLGTFIDDREDWKHVDALRAMCAEVHVEQIGRGARLSSGVRALVAGEPVTLPYFRSRALRRWVEAVVERKGVRHLFAFSSPMAQYALRLRDVRTVVDFVDLDSAKWIEYARRRSWPLSALYRREGERLLAFESDVARRVDASIFVTDDEVRLLRSRSASIAKPVLAIRNGVDSEYFSPSMELRSPFGTGQRAIVFTGAMDYWPNVDAVLWFAREVFPEILKAEPAAHFYIVGMNPETTVRALSGTAAVSVTGRVPDVRPYLQYASTVVAPLRVARGIQNKVLEAMAMGKAVVASAASAEPLTAEPGVDIEVGREPRDFAAKVLATFDRGHARQMGTRARARVLSDYAWSSSYRQLDQLFAQGTDGLRRGLAGCETDYPNDWASRPLHEA